jgi:hypothetical protein
MIHASNSINPAFFINLKIAVRKVLCYALQCGGSECERCPVQGMTPLARQLTPA